MTDNRHPFTCRTYAGRSCIAALSCCEGIRRTMDFEKYGGKKKKKEKKKPQRSERSIFDPGGGAPSVHSAGSPAIGAGDTATAVQLHPPSSGSGVAHAGSSARQSGFPQSGKLRGSHMGAAAPSPKPRPQQWDAANTYRHSSLRTQRRVDHRGHKYNQHNQNYVAQRDFEKSEVGLDNSHPIHFVFFRSTRGR